MAYRQNSTDLSGILALGSDWNFKDIGYFYGCGSTSTPFPNEIGFNWYDNITSPTLLLGSTAWKQVSVGYNHGLAVSNNGYVWAWGSNELGQLGIADEVIVGNRAYPIPVEVITDMQPCKYVCASGTIDDPNADNSSFAISSDYGYLWAWGYNAAGQLGVGDNVDKSAPTQVGTASWEKAVCVHIHTAAIDSSGKLYTWGHNGAGQLGASSLLQRSSPVRVGSSYWLDVAVGWKHTIGVKTDGTLWSWGLNDYGQLGINDVTVRSSPCQIGSLNTWRTVAAHHNQSFAIKTDGTLWSWGLNDYGQLGLGDTNPRSSPVQVGSIIDWIAVSCGAYHTLALRHNTTTGRDEIHGTGSDSSGQLGGIGSKTSMNLLHSSGNNPDDGIYQISTSPEGSFWKSLNTSEY